MVGKSILWRWSRGVLAAVAVVSVLCGCWNPMMFHPYAYSRGKVLNKGQVELSAQTLLGVWTGGGISAGMGKQLEIRGQYGYTGDDVLGGGVELTRTVISRSPHFLSVTAGMDWFKNDEHDFDGHRWQFGPTFSWYPGGGTFGWHLLAQGYVMDYRWGHGWDESTTSVIDSASGTQFFFVVGSGASYEYKRVDFHAVCNVPTVKKVDQIELLPYVGIQVSLKLGKVEKRLGPPSEFSQH